MATFTNFATLTYSGGTTTSNTVTGELLEVLTATKRAVDGSYGPGDDVTYVITLVNSGTAAISGVTVTDDLGGYALEGETVYPLAYVPGSVLYYVNGTPQAAPAVTAGPPLVFTGVSVPAGGNATLVYEAQTTGFADPSAEGSITNIAAVSGGGLASPVTAQATVTADDRTLLTVTKSLTPAAVADNGTLTYSFVIENSGNTPAVATDPTVLTDVFDPILSSLTVTYNGAVWTEGVEYTYDETTGTFATLPGAITVPAASYERNADGSWRVVPGAGVLTVSGTV